MTSQQGRRELGDRSVLLFHPPTPSCQDSSITGGTLQGDERLRTTLGVIFSILRAQLQDRHEEHPAWR